MEHAVILDVEPSTAVRQAEVTAANTMIERTHDRFDQPQRFQLGRADNAGCVMADIRTGMARSS